MNESAANRGIKEKRHQKEKEERGKWEGYIY